MQKLGIVAGVLALLLVWGLYKINEALRQPFSPRPPLSGSDLSAGDEAPVPVTFDAPVNLLVLGYDSRPGDPGRSDSMMLVSFDATVASEPKVRLLSLQRDTWVEIPGHGYDKLNHAFAFGGVDLAKKTVEKLVDLPVDHVVLVDMQGLTKIVDSLGGVDIQVEEEMHYDDPKDTPPLHIHFTKGLHHMDGRDALLYVRYRRGPDGDFGRMKRQQQLLRALASKATQPENLLRLNSLLKATQEAISTDLTYGDLLRMALAGRKIQSANITAQAMTGSDRWIDGGYYLEADLVQLRTAAYKTLTGQEPDAAFVEKARRDQVTYVASIPKHQTVAVTAAADPKGPADDGAADDGGAAPIDRPLTVGIRDGSGLNLAPLYMPYVAGAGWRVLPLGLVPDMPKTTIVMRTVNPKLEQGLVALFPAARVVYEPQADAAAPAEIWLGQDLSANP
jgi:LCP family protein required for cell wall assembly